MSLARLLAGSQADTVTAASTTEGLPAHLVIAGDLTGFITHLVAIESKAAQVVHYIDWEPGVSIDAAAGALGLVNPGRRFDVLVRVPHNNAPPHPPVIAEMVNLGICLIDRCSGGVTSHIWLCVNSGCVNDATLHDLDTLAQHSGQPITLVVTDDDADSAARMRNALDAEPDTIGSYLNSAAPLPEKSDPPLSKEGTQFAAQADSLREELGLIHEALSSATDKLEMTHEGLTTSREALRSVRDEHAATGNAVANLRNELRALHAQVRIAEGELVATTEHSEAARRELDHLLVHRDQLSRDLTVERTALEDTRAEVLTLLAHAEQLRSACTRSGIDASLHRLAADEAVRQADAARAELQRSEESISSLQSLIEGAEAALRHRHDQLAALERQRLEALADAERAEQDLQHRVQPLREQIDRLHQRHEAAVGDVQRADADLAAVRAALDALSGDVHDPHVAAARITRDLLASTVEQLDTERTRLTDECERLAARLADTHATALTAERHARTLEAEASRADAAAIAARDAERQAVAAVAVIEERRRHLEQQQAALEAQQRVLRAEFESFAVRQRDAELRLQIDHQNLAHRRSELDTEVARRVSDRISEIESLPWRRRRRLRATARASRRGTPT